MRRKAYFRRWGVRKSNPRGIGSCKWIEGHISSRSPYILEITEEAVQDGFLRSILALYKVKDPVLVRRWDTQTYLVREKTDQEHRTRTEWLNFEDFAKFGTITP